MIITLQRDKWRLAQQNINNIFENNQLFKNLQGLHAQIKLSKHDFNNLMCWYNILNVLCYPMSMPITLIVNTHKPKNIISS
jgi:hypothetical protein